MVFMTARTSLRMMLCAPAVERNLFFSLWMKHFHEQKMELLGGAMPVFIAATIATAVAATITAMIKDDFEASIWFSVIWALIVCQAIAYYVVVYLPRSLPSHNFWFRITMENCAFAWKEALYLIIYYKYMYMYSPIEFSGVWIGFLGMCAFLVACTGLLQNHLISDTMTLLQAKILNAEIYSLGLAYTLNLVTLADACGPDFLTSIKSDDDHAQVNADPKCYPTLIFYPLFVTAIITVLLSMGLFDTAAALVHEGEHCADEKEIEEMHHRQSGVIVRKSQSAQSHFSDSSREWGGDGESGPQHTEAQAADGQGQAHGQKHGHGHQSYNDCYTQTGASLSACCRPVDAAFCSWDDDRTASISVSMMLYVLLGLYCGSSWFVYALLQFRFLLHGPKFIAYTVFSLVITLLSIVYLTSLDTVYEWDHHHHGSKARWSNTKSKRKEVLSMAAR
jgi:hypothetical protein